jgi:SAM-dependent methyltransferase
MAHHLSDAFLKEIIDWSVRKSDAPKRHKHHLTRFAMYKALEKRFAGLAGQDAKVLSISRSVVLQEALGLSGLATTSADFPEYNILDLSTFSDGQFDFCISDQVFEHVEGDPFRAFAESVRVVKPGGYVCHTTCFINPIHGSPKDFWRYTPDALALLASQAGCEDIYTDSWGNLDVWAMVDLGLRRVKVPDEPGHPIFELATRNDRRWPITVWVVGRKPAAKQKLRKNVGGAS